MVMNNEIPPGARVNIDALAQDLGVSQTPVREALARLEADDLVRKEPLRGYRTTPLLTREQFADLYELRLLLEGWATERAARQITSHGGAALMSELDSVRVVPSGNEYEAYRSITDHDTRFHGLIFELAGNEVVRSVWARTHCHLHLFRLLYAGMLGTRALQEHRLIAEAIGAGDVAGSVAAMQAHLEASRARLLPATSPASSRIKEE
jgi:DNA-binding GntR family transcriptional regulator